MDSPLTMFVVVRRDLLKTLNWPTGSVIAQGCHAATAALWTFRDHPDTLAYVASENLPRMNKVVYQIKNESQLQTLATLLAERGIDHALWREQPENILTALATRPISRDAVGDAFRKCSLFN